MTYAKRTTAWMLLDSLLLVFGLFMAEQLVNMPLNQNVLLVTMAAIVISHHALAHLYKLYKKVWSYASVGELMMIFIVATFAQLLTAMTQMLLFQEMTPRVLVISWMFHILFIGGARFSWRMVRSRWLPGKKPGVRTLVVGAGSAGTMVARQLLNSHQALIPVAFIDDDGQKRGMEIMGLPVYGGTDKMLEVVNEKEIQHIVIAIPSLPKDMLRKLVSVCRKTNIKTQTLPHIEDLISGKVQLNQFKDVEVEDLLGREPVRLDTESVAGTLTGKTVLVTGAGGSIGSEICRQVASFTPGRLILLGHGENSIYSIEMELRRSWPDLPIDTEIADIQYYDKMEKVLQKHAPEVVYHAAAHKHVPLMERNPEEAIKNNVMGTKNVAMASDAANVKTFVMVSTDKAVNPTSVMGASKRLAEMIVQHMNSQSHTRFVAVRFGNVLGSRGSVIPLFKEQIKSGGPVTVTHPDMRRYFMTIPEASRLVIQAGALAHGGEIFVLDMGEPVRIVDLAHNLIHLSGYSADDIPVTFTGMRPGEKLFEELLGADEAGQRKVHPKIYVGKTATLYIGEIEHLLATFSSMSGQDIRKAVLHLANRQTKVPEPAAQLVSSWS
ncbi:polysaccharide biosynthesis protein [Aureibacillus halotolerans]|uniref:FlaA1/EpsC-like NDP-sugar epimerase n=1 Tax=Aureibacillus halotolerans TaxID=1508390 RepID=A0A4V3D573_9BACI|nr:nucleoside-diphosphate sugar epimerase/dehydratase [Aureibacillus halotolerans]TDQ38687.1 FlaA1/EpsC-like NDP-sugar epimerase [Aureibacillus halotolerans]